MRPRAESERRWLVVGEDGRHVTLGRDSDPSADELAQVEAALDAQGIAAFLAILEGDYWSRSASPMLAQVRPIGTRQGNWDTAEDAFRRKRCDALGIAEPAGRTFSPR